MPFDTQHVNTGTILDRAIALIEAGWCQGTAHMEPYAGEHHYCLVGALHQAMQDFNLPCGNVDPRLVGFDSATDAVVWNDYSHRTKADVLARLRAARSQFNAV